MKTFQDLIEVGEGDKERAEFCLSALQLFQGTELFKTAQDADAYYRHRNPTIARAQKIIYNLMGQATPDLWKPNHKIASRFYYYFITQEVSYLLGNGVLFSDLKDKERILGKDFDQRVMDVATAALNAGVAFGFWNLDHLEVFPVYDANGACFCPLYDEETGALRAGIRWWQMNSKSPLRITLYEEDGITDYIRRDSEDITLLRAKSPYRYEVRSSEATGVEIVGVGNYSSLPIIPLYNANRQSEIVGGRNTLDAYDLMISGLVNNTDEGNLIYWVLKNANAMDEEDDANFLAQLYRTHVAHADGDDGVGVEHEVVEVPVAASKETLEQLRMRLFDDFMALDVKAIANGAATATQIRAAYEPLNEKVGQFEMKVVDFLTGILSLAGVDEMPTFRRDVIVNQTEEVTNILQAAQYLDTDTVTEQLCGVLGLVDRIEDVLARRKEEEIGRAEPINNEEDTENE